MVCYRTTFFFVLLSLVSASSLAAQETPESRELIVATKEIPPFVLKSETNTWSGISIDLWRAIAEKLELKFVFQEHNLDSMFAGLEDKTIDVAVGALTITPERDEKFDFTHAYYHSGIGIAVVREAKPSGWSKVAKLLTSTTFLEVISLLALILLGLGVLIWFLERKRNPEQFGGSVVKGIGSGFWWSAVTMTTVGYGDKSPRSPAGRLVAVLWMFVSLFLLAFFTASVTSALTVAELSTTISGPEDFPGHWIGCIRGSTGHDYLRERHPDDFRAYESPQELMAALASGKVDAAVHDAPVLRYLSKKEVDGKITVLPRRLQRESYAFGLSEGSGLREAVNRQLLREIESSHWTDTLNRYMSN